MHLWLNLEEERATGWSLGPNESFFFEFAIVAEYEIIGISMGFELSLVVIFRFNPRAAFADALAVVQKSSHFLSRGH
jgi:hypothetical protein